MTTPTADGPGDDARVGPGQAVPPDGPPPGSPPPDPGPAASAHDPDPSGELTAALRDAITELDRHEASGEGRPAARKARRDLRSTLSSVTTRLMAERTLRAAEVARSAAEAVEAARIAAEEIGVEPAEEVKDGRLARLGGRTGPLAAFRIGFFAGLGLLLAYVTYESLDSIRSTLILIAIAALLAIGLDPPVGWLIRHGLRRSLAVTVVFLALLLLIAAAIYAIIPPIVNEVGTFVTSVPSLIAGLQRQQWIQDLDQRFNLLQQLQDSNFIQNMVSGASGGIVSAGVTVAGIIVDLLIVLVLTLYFLAGFPQIKRTAYRLAPASRRRRISLLADKVLKQMGGYLSGATLIAIQAGLVAGVFAAIIGLPYPWAIALAAGVLDFVPVVGPILIGIGMTLLGFTQSLTLGIVAGLFYLCQHLFEAYWLYPRVMRRTVDISTGAVVVAIVIGGALLGVTGAILAVPVAAAISLIVREVVMPIQERS
ncbi:AI-2E family transporter [Nakamurella leprariae]|uniref:AI-2E family transporter n=1 Tax=Nakamurella leprariae TaxID=2803911 RepID=A0A938YAS5_9ACTN|nr:AI-2E family transporter [Nakamurella leprariae]MBM9469096.1 AI-2E family transporter [Nakamurella leprariae]